MSPRLRALAARGRFLRFLISGGINTVATYATYLALLSIFEYRLAYSIAYVTGIFLSYVFNRTFVFQTHRGWRSVLLFPFVYLTQYMAGLAIVWAWVGQLHLAQSLAPLVAILVTIPLTYLLSRYVFVPQDRRDQGRSSTFR
jgi:putative flippase GtrA